MGVSEAHRTSYTGPTSDLASFSGALNSTTDAKDAHTGEYEGGALRPGGMANLYSKDYFGLIMNYICIGFVYGGLPGLKTMVFKKYLGMESYQAMAAYTLMLLPWSFKTFIGIVTDSFPIMGYNRRYYILGGWSICAVILLLVAIGLPLPEPYHVAGTTDILNADAPAAGGKYIALLALATLSYVIADVACDGYVVELGQREPLDKRGYTQTTVYMYRQLTFGFAKLALALLMNGKDYGGEFGFTIGFNGFVGICGAVSLLPIVTTLFFLKEEKVGDRVEANFDESSPEVSVQQMTFGQKLKEMWHLSHSRCIWQILLFNFVYIFFAAIFAPSSISVGYDWAEITPLTENIASFLTYMFFAFGMWYIKTYALNLNWHMLLIISQVAMTLLDATSSLLTIYDVIRNKYFYLGPTVVEGLPSGINFIVASWVTVEIAQPGYEAATYGLITTVHNLAIPFASTVSNFLGSFFNAYESAFERDSAYDRNQVAGQYFVQYGCWLFALVFLFLLPRNKVEAQQLKKTGGSNSTVGGSILVFFGLCLIYTTVCNFLSIFESTACLKIAGGDGC